MTFTSPELHIYETKNPLYLSATKGTCVFLGPSVQGFSNVWMKYRYIGVSRVYLRAITVAALMIGTIFLHLEPDKVEAVQRKSALKFISLYKND